jgi:hypothetical protein
MRGKITDVVAHCLTMVETIQFPLGIRNYGNYLYRYSMSDG